MKKNGLILCLVLAGSALTALAQFDSGSDGSYGPIAFTNGGYYLTLQVPPGGAFNCTTIYVPQGKTLNFARNAANTPVYLLATGDVDIEGTIEVSATGRLAGPGGFDGGMGSTAGLPPSDGEGPGGGRGGDSIDMHSASTNVSDVGHAGYATMSAYSRPGNGQVYGNSLLIPLVGGSGGGGTSDGKNGNGGGGALLIASSTQITIGYYGRIYTKTLGNQYPDTGDGSAGAIRLVAPIVQGSGFLDASGSSGGDGRVRIDTMRRDLAGQLGLAGYYSIGGNMVVFPENMPALEIVEVAGQPVNPASQDPVYVMLPAGSASAQPVKVRARNFNGTAEAKVALTPVAGTRTEYDISIPDPGPGPGEATVTVDFPPNVQTRVDAWIR